MNKARTFLIFGIWIAILPYLGFPISWKKTLFTLTGLFLIYLGYLAYREYKKNSAQKTFENFSENHHQASEETN